MQSLKDARPCPLCFTCLSLSISTYIQLQSQHNLLTIVSTSQEYSLFSEQQHVFQDQHDPWDKDCFGHWVSRITPVCPGAPAYLCLLLFYWDLTTDTCSADRGIGLEFCKQLEQEGYLVVATAKDAVNASELNDLCKAHQDRIFVQQLDQTKEDEIKNLTEALRTRNYRLDLLVLNAGIAEHEHPNVTASQIDRYVLL